MTTTTNTEYQKLLEGEDEFSQKTPLLKSASHREEKIDYYFSGTLAVFPAMILLFGGGAGILMSKGGTPIATAEWAKSEKLRYWVAGIVLALVAMVCLYLCVRWLVIKVSFIFTPNMFIIRKIGVFRSCDIEFSLANTTFHIYRDSFSDYWLQLVIQENGIFHQVYSWKGSGNQRDRFLKLFRRLRDELILRQQRGGFSPSPKYSSHTLILSREQILVLSPFGSRLNELASLPGFDQLTTKVLCLEELRVDCLDKFFNHFVRYKHIEINSSQLNTRKLA